MSQYTVVKSDGVSVVIEAERWSIMNFNEPGTPEEIVPSPCAHTADGSVMLFDPRVKVINSRGDVEYDGPSLYTVVGDQIVRRRFPE